MIRENYNKAKGFDEVYPFIEELYQFRPDRLMNYTFRSIMMIMELLDIKINIVCASSLHAEGKKSSLIVDIMNKLGAHKYISGAGAKEYHNQKLFDEAGIEVVWQDYKHPVYKQQYEGFIPYLSTIDLLLNCGIKESRRIVRNP